MNFQVSRNGQMYGPYTLADLERYVASGNVLLTDLAKSEEMPEWLPVSQILHRDAAASATPAYGAVPSASPYQGAYAGAASVSPDPPNLSWVLVLVFDLLTCSFFQLVWNIILGAWFRRVSPSSKALLLYIAAGILLIFQYCVGRIYGVNSGNTFSHFGRMSGHHMVFGQGLAIYGLVSLITWVTRLVARFIFRAELEYHFNTVDPVGLRLGPVMTFFFGGIYFQYHINRINTIKQAARYRGPAL